MAAPRADRTRRGRAAAEPAGREGEGSPSMDRQHEARTDPSLPLATQINMFASSPCASRVIPNSVPPSLEELLGW